MGEWEAIARCFAVPLRCKKNATWVKSIAIFHTPFHKVILHLNYNLPDRQRISDVTKNGCGLSRATTATIRLAHTVTTRQESVLFYSFLAAHTAQCRFDSERWCDEEKKKSIMDDSLFKRPTGSVDTQPMTSLLYGCVTAGWLRRHPRTPR